MQRQPPSSPRKEFQSGTGISFSCPFLIEGRLQTGSALYDNLIGIGFGAANERFASPCSRRPVGGLRIAERLQQRLHAIDSYDLPGVGPIFRFRY